MAGSEKWVHLVLKECRHSIGRLREIGKSGGRKWRFFLLFLFLCPLIKQGKARIPRKAEQISRNVYMLTARNAM